ncbi:MULTISPECIES: hypothetical protein [unclassified Lysobacter]|uniref:hypothetical protein n=1 Tax=unclassified Lysobacter TaxID=2635362 RepID=UPI001BE9CB6C|nr:MULTISPECIES: hypothetical protein [unclassified Lysobacter]MBT2748726.1 hypothetical protein [Lysobacter sp. ISL-42]MBT2751661.1 hypothetical protein [Lysobacter sp. ISL-50]MBT2775855.1 hypothetical protein [Lysobacter sp. ISL-54]MBT2782181.1 hypothetical protein [Lysobacter sp. ISL-52]
MAQSTGPVNLRAERFMGIHVTYHPCAPSDVHGLYFDQIGRDASIERLALQLGLDPDASARLKALLAHGGRSRPREMSLCQAHVYNAAKVSELLCNCWYTNCCRFSALLELPDFGQYATDWHDLMAGVVVLERTSNERLVPRNDGIVFLGCEGLKRLRADYAEYSALRFQLDRVFPRGWLPVFWAAADYAVARGGGLIEAVNLVRPDVIAPSSLMA